ncbi:ATP-grasp domain-containing protein [Streptomyces sp. SID7982]|nr:ATP-grasp domain-containing protein [Streptomyces sp. SID7982]
MFSDPRCATAATREGELSSRPLVLFFGSVQMPEFYDGLLGSDADLGLIRDTAAIHPLEPAEFALVERTPFDAGAEAVAERIMAVTAGRRLESVLNIDESLVQLWAHVCELLGLPAMSRAAAAAVRSKSEMRRRFASRIGLHASAASMVVADEQQAADFAGTTGYPVIIKPGNLWGSYLVTRCTDEEELRLAHRRLSAALPALTREKRAGDAPMEILVEELLIGTNHSVECLVLGDEVWTTPVVDVVTGMDLGQTDFHHFARSTATRLSSDECAAMRALAADAVRALDMDRGVAHVEFVQSPTGPRLIEVAGRPGANRGPLLEAAYGIDLMGAYRDVLRGREPAVTPRRSGAAALVTPFPDRAGELLAYRGLETIRALPSTALVDLYSHPGDFVTPRSQGAIAPMAIDLRADTPGELAADMRQLVCLSSRLFDVSTA